MACGRVVIALAFVLGTVPSTACAPDSAGTPPRDEGDGGRDDADGGADADYVPEARDYGDAEPVRSFIWIANTGEGTLSKVNTVSAVEVSVSTLLDGDPFTVIDGRSG